MVGVVGQVFDGLRISPLIALSTSHGCPSFMFVITLCRRCGRMWSRS